MKHLTKEWTRIKDIVKGKRLCLFLDFDGTLTRIRRHPAKVKLSAKTRGAVKNLASLKNVSVAIVSGRSLEDITKRAGIKNITYAGNHGLEIKGPKGRHTVKEAKGAQKDISAINKKIKSKIKTLIDDHEKRLQIQKNQLKLFDGKGVQRIVDEIEKRQDLYV